MSAIATVFKRELASYFATPVAYVFIVIFLVARRRVPVLSRRQTFFERSQADLLPFFNFHPWLYLFLVPAVGMRLWAEERKSGTIELLLTLPLTMWQAVVGKFLAAWVFIGIALVPDVSDLDHRQLSRLARQRRDLRELHRQFPHGRRVPRHRFVHLARARATRSSRSSSPWWCASCSCSPDFRSCSPRSVRGRRRDWSMRFRV